MTPEVMSFDKYLETRRECKLTRNIVIIMESVPIMNILMQLLMMEDLLVW